MDPNYVSGPSFNQTLVKGSHIATSQSESLEYHQTRQDALSSGRLGIRVQLALLCTSHGFSMPVFFLEFSRHTALC